MKYDFSKMFTSAAEIYERREELLAHTGVGKTQAWIMSPICATMIWQNTPQGVDFWLKHHENNTAEGRAAIEEMIAQAKAEIESE